MCTNMSRYKPRFKREEEGLRQRSHDHEQEKEITKIHQMTELAGNFPGKSTFEKQVIQEVHTFLLLWQKGFDFQSSTLRVQIKTKQFLESILSNSTPDLQTFANEALGILCE